MLIACLLGATSIIIEMCKAEAVHCFAVQQLWAARANAIHNHGLNPARLCVGEPIELLC